MAVIASAGRLTGSPATLAQFASQRLRERVDAVWLTAMDEPAGLAEALGPQIGLALGTDTPDFGPNAASISSGARKTTQMQAAPVPESLIAGNARVLGDWARGQIALPDARLEIDLDASAALLEGLGGRAAERVASALAGALLSLPGTPILPLSLIAGAFTADNSVDADAWVAGLAEAPTTQTRIADAIARLLRARSGYPAFASGGRHDLPDAGRGVFAIIRDAPNAGSALIGVQQKRVVCLVNMSGEEQLASLDWRVLLGTRNAIRDLVTGIRFNVHGPSLGLAPYQVVWATI